MSMLRRIASAVVVVLALFASVSADDSPLPIDPAQAGSSAIHLEEAAAKAAALQQMRLSMVPNLVLDQSGFDAVHYRIELAIDEVTEQIVGSTTMTARARTDGFNAPTLNFLDPMVVDSVKTAGQSIGWIHTGGFIYTTLPAVYNTGDVFDLTVYFHGRPTEGGFQGFAFDLHAGVPIISTLSEPYMAQSWWPCKDTPSDKADSVDMIVTVNEAFYAVSNGSLVDSTGNGDGTSTYHWRESYPITTYLVSLAITNYERFTRWYHYGVDSMPVNFYCYPESLSTALLRWPITVNQIEAFAGYFGEYPFLTEKYGIAHFPWGGAMEHQTVSSHTYSSFGFNEYLIAHELAHQWWGDLVTCRDWHHIWMNEGFASYAEALWAEHNGGATAYRNYMGSMQYFSGGRIYIDDTTNVGNIFSLRVYDKGAWVLHMLRGVIGDADFFDLLHAYYNAPQFRYKDVVTEEFRDLAEAVSGQDLNWFFDEWIYGFYYPQYYYSSVCRGRTDGQYDLFVRVRQAQTSNPQTFIMPVPVVVGTGAGADTIILWNSLRDQDFHLIRPDSAVVTNLDPLNWILDAHNSETYGVQLVSDSLIDAVQYEPYSDSLIAACSNPAVPITLTVVNGVLPAGLSLDPATGRVTGIPTDTADGSFLMRAAATGFTNDHKQIRITIHPAPYLPGDQNGDRVLDVTDVVDLVNYVFRAGPPPSPLNAADPNGDCVSNVADIVRLIDHVWRGGAMPLAGCLE
jgi:aminopeptidase N